MEPYNHVSVTTSPKVFNTFLLLSLKEKLNSKELANMHFYTSTYSCKPISDKFPYFHFKIFKIQNDICRCSLFCFLCDILNT